MKLLIHLFSCLCRVHLHEEASANLYEMQEFAAESCAVRIDVSAKCHAVQGVVRGKTVARHEAEKHFFFSFSHLRPSLIICLSCRSVSLVNAP